MRVSGLGRKRGACRGRSAWLWLWPGVKRPSTPRPRAPRHAGVYSLYTFRLNWDTSTASACQLACRQGGPACTDAVGQPPARDAATCPCPPPHATPDVQGSFYDSLVVAVVGFSILVSGNYLMMFCGDAL